MTYDWDLIERLLLEAQASANQPYKPRIYAEEVAEEHLREGEPVPGGIDHFKRVGGDLEGVLFYGGFIEPRPEELGGTGRNFILTERGARLLSYISQGFPQHQSFRRWLDEKGEAALEGEVFDEVAARVEQQRPG
ncbi:hypothetical protein D9M68_351990 [compost metagenome]